MSIQGKLLVALPNIKGGLFHKSVVYLHNFDAFEGAMGFMINKPYPSHKSKLIAKSLSIPHESRIYFGGPVEQQTGFVLHSSDYAAVDTGELLPGINYTPGTNILNDIQRGIGPSNYMVILGHAKWGIGQLEKEIKGLPPYNGNNWIMCEPGDDYFYGTLQGNAAWKQAVEQSARERSTFMLDK